MADGPSTGFDRRNIEAIHPLTSMQRSLLYASLYARRNRVDPGFLQVRSTLRGRLNETAFETAWERITERHAALRTSVHWTNVDRPLQVVTRRVSLASISEDLRKLDSRTQNAHIDAWLENDRLRGIDLTRAPLFRLARFHRSEDEWTLVMTCHHVLLDGWSGAFVLNEVLTAHDALAAGKDPTLPPPRSFAAFIAWVIQQDQTEADSFWREQLRGVHASAKLPLPYDPATARRNVPATATSSEIDRDRTNALGALARSERLTLGTLAQLAWALLIAARSRNPDVCFGITVSGRSAPLDGIESIVGTFINVLPVRLRIRTDATVSSAGRDLQQVLTGLRRFEHTPPDLLQQWSGLPGHQRIFESLVVIENLPDHKTASDSGLVLSDLVGGVSSNAPITLMVVPGQRIELRLLHDPGLIDTASAHSILDDYVAILDAFISRPDASVGTLLEAIRTQHMGESGELASGPKALHNGGSVSEDEEPVSTDPFEFQLVQLFQSVLGVPAIGLHDDFFDMGGHSLVAAQLFDRIEKVFGKRLPLATLFEASTPHALASRLRSDGWSAPWASLVAMQTTGAVPPLFCIHSYEGHILHYRDLANRLAPDQQVYGLQSIGLNGATPPIERIEDMAARYLAEMRTVQPRGPYALAAICFGIAVALEIAQRLVVEGDEVARLFILDSGFHQLLPAPPRPDESVLSLIGRRVHARARGLATRAARLVASVRETEQERHARLVRQTNERAWRAYLPQRYPGTITLIRSAGYASRQDWHVEMWSSLGTALETYIVPGDHRDLIRDPNAEHLANCIRACLASTATV
jgi:thioesterase domain-containing protein